MAEPEADRAGRAQSVGGFQDDQAATGTDEQGSGAQELAQRGVEVTGASEAFGELVEGGEVRDHARQPVLDDTARAAGRRGRCGGGPGGRGRRSVRRRRYCWIDSSHFRQMRGAHGVRLSTWCDSPNSIANPQIVLRRHQGIHIYTHTWMHVQHCPGGNPGVRGAATHCRAKARTWPEKREAVGFCDRLSGLRRGLGYVLVDARGQLALQGTTRRGSSSLAAAAGPGGRRGSRSIPAGRLMDL